MDEFQPTPPAEAVQLTSDGLLHKLVLQEGSGEVPPKHARCLVHYVGRLAECGTEFINTRQDNNNQEPEQIVAGRDTTHEGVGLNLAVATMRCGEKCRVWAAPQYGYGERGNFSFPTVPPNAHLIYDLEVLDWEPADDGKELGAMTFEERMEAAERRRQDGNALFKQEQYDEALSKYRLSLSYLNEDLLMQLGDYHFAKAMDVKRPVLLNIAAVQLRQEDYHAAVATCSEVLQEDKQNPKALYRRGKARHALGQTQDALADLQAAREAAPQDRAIARELALVKKEVQEETAAAGQVFKGYFDKATETLYDEPLPPATPEASVSEAWKQGSKRLASPLHLPSYMRVAAVVALAGVAMYWCLQRWQPQLPLPYQNEISHA